MSNYNFIPFIDGRLRYELAHNCVSCNNINDACEKAKYIKSNLGADFVTIVKHITQI